MRSWILHSYATSPIIFTMMVAFLTVDANAAITGKGRDRMADYYHRAALRIMDDTSKEGNVRISWDYNTYQEMTSFNVSNGGGTETNLYYPRIKRLSDGSLLMSCSNQRYGPDIYTRRSEDNGKTWSDALMVREHFKARSTVGEDDKIFVNPDFIELKDGRVLLAYQWRYKLGYGDIPNTNENCGMEIVFSTDKGKTFSKPREVYRGRAWEPAFLQLPSGEIQMYLTSSQEVVNKVSYPRTVVIRSFDGGETWQGKRLASYRDNEAISRTIDDRYAFDGMPTAVWLDDNNGIAVPLEVWHSKLVVDQTPIIIKTDANVNWHGDQKKILEKGGPDYPYKKQVNNDLWGYGPYCTKLNTGEVVVLCNGTYKGVQGIWTLIGDKKADNFRFATSPFTGHWGSIDYIGDGRVLATATVDYVDEKGTNRSKVLLMQGRLNYSKIIQKGEPPMPSPTEFNRERNGYWFLGKASAASVFTDFGYTNDNLIFSTYLFDKNIAAFTTENSDASVVLFSRSNGGTTQNYKFAVNAAGKYTIYREENYSWHLIEKGVTKDIKISGTINNEKDEDLGFCAKVKVDWKLLGGTPAPGEVFRAHLRHFYKTKATEKPLSILEDMEGENSDYPGEWLRLILK